MSTCLKILVINVADSYGEEANEGQVEEVEVTEVSLLSDQDLNTLLDQVTSSLAARKKPSYWIEAAANKMLERGLALVSPRHRADVSTHAGYVPAVNIEPSKLVKPDTTLYVRGRDGLTRVNVANVGASFALPSNATVNVDTPFYCEVELSAKHPFRKALKAFKAKKEKADAKAKEAKAAAEIAAAKALLKNAGIPVE
jgi:hypothetical protein